MVGLTVQSGAASAPAAPVRAMPRPNRASQHHRQVDAEQADHLAVATAGAEDAAVRCVPHEDPKAEQQRQRDGDEGNAIVRDQDRAVLGDAREDLRRLERMARSSPDHLDQRLDQEGEREGHDQVDQWLLTVGAAEEQDLRRHRDDAEQDGREDHRWPAECLVERQREVRP